MCTLSFFSLLVHFFFSTTNILFFQQQYEKFWSLIVRQNPGHAVQWDKAARGEIVTYTVLQADHLNLLLWGEVTSGLFVQWKSVRAYITVLWYRAQFPKFWDGRLFFSFQNLANSPLFESSPASVETNFIFQRWNIKNLTLGACREKNLYYTRLGM